MWTFVVIVALLFMILLLSLISFRHNKIPEGYSLSTDSDSLCIDSTTTDSTSADSAASADYYSNATADEATDDSENDGNSALVYYDLRGRMVRNSDNQSGRFRLEFYKDPNTGDLSHCTYTNISVGVSIRMNGVCNSDSYTFAGYDGNRNFVIRLNNTSMYDCVGDGRDGTEELYITASDQAR